MNKLIEMLKGKKRYLMIGALAITVILKSLGYSIPNSVYSILGLEDVKVTPITETVDSNAK